MTADEFKQRSATSTKGENIEYFRTSGYRALGLDTACDPIQGKTSRERLEERKRVLSLRAATWHLAREGEIALVQNRLPCGETAYIAQVRK